MITACPDPSDHSAQPVARLHDMVFPDQSNHHGTLFGGAALAMLDKLAFILASRCLRRRFVTAGVNQLDFVAPVRGGELAEASARVVRHGRRSLEIEAELFAEDLCSGTRTRCVTGRFVMVADGSEPVRLQPVPRCDDPRQVRVAEIVFPGHVNHQGILHGGPALSWLSKAALVAASRQARLPLVIASAEGLDFTAPARVGDIVEIAARVTAVGRSSVTVETVMEAESPLSGERQQCVQAGFVFVAVGSDGRPTPVDMARTAAL